MSVTEPKPFRQTRIAGVSVAAVSEADLVDRMIADCCANRGSEAVVPVVVADLNGQAISMKETNRDYAKALAAADIVHADGQFIVWLSRILPGPAIPERTATTDLIHACARGAAQNGLGFYLLGGSEDINARCADELVRRNPGLKISGRRNGYFPDEEEEAVVAAINASGADVLWVGLGKPKEQIFAMRNQDRLTCSWIVTCGGCFNFVVGTYRRAPRWMQASGLEWLHRMATGPRYLIWRYLVTIPHALAIVFVRDVLRLQGRLEK
ncbi:MAG: glycosyltransferase [Rhodobacterales bacterium]|nr:MAG: glycosyltransferase [Rhodobacterales bacterium]